MAESSNKLSWARILLDDNSYARHLLWDRKYARIHVFNPPRLNSLMCCHPFLLHLWQLCFDILARPRFQQPQTAVWWAWRIAPSGTSALVALPQVAWRGRCQLHVLWYAGPKRIAGRILRAPAFPPRSLKKILQWLARSERMIPQNRDYKYQRRYTAPSTYYYKALHCHSHFLLCCFPY